MKKKIITSLIIVLLAAAGLFWVVTRDDDSDTGDKLTVAASYYPLYEFAEAVGGDKIAATNMTPPGADSHDYEPSAKDIADAQQAAVFMYNGAGYEPWAESFLQNYQGVVVDASHDIALLEGDGHEHEHEEDEDHADEDAAHDEHETEEQEHHGEEDLDPHFWLDPVLAQQVVNNIRDGLIEADPSNADFYTDNAAAYNQQLAALDQEFAQGLQNCAQDTIIATHNAFTYLAKRYGFEVEAIAGLTHDDEPSADRLADLIDHVRDDDIKYVFFEELASPRLADTIANETGAETLVLNPIEGLTDEETQTGQTYLSVQQQNLGNLRQALACD